MSKSNYLEDNLLNHVLRGIPYTPPAAIYVALFTTAPTEVTPGTEVSGGSYARQPVTFTAPSGGTCANVADVTFPIATLGWGIVTSFGLFDQGAAGNLLYYASLTAPRDVLVNDQIRFPASQLLVTED
jgi:hypothetical protein